MGGGRCWRCGLARLEADVKCVGCGAALAPASARRRGAGPPRILLGRAAVLAVREDVAPAGPLTNVARYYLGGASTFILALWAYAVLLFSVWLVFGLWVLVYTLPFIVYPALSVYCSVRLMPSRRVAALGLCAHLYMVVCALAVHYISDRQGADTGGASLFGWAFTLSFVATWAALYAGRLMDEGRLRVGRAAQATLGVLLVASTVCALFWSHASDRRARERRFETRTYERR